MRVVPDGRLCGCGNHGCFEQYASGTALVREAREAAARPARRGAQALLDRGRRRPRRDHRAADHRGRPGRRPVRASSSSAELGRWLGEGIASLAAVLDPAVVVIGGGVSEAGDLLLDPIRDGVRAST